MFKKLQIQKETLLSLSVQQAQNVKGASAETTESYTQACNTLEEGCIVLTPPILKSVRNQCNNATTQQARE